MTYTWQNTTWQTNGIVFHEPQPIIYYTGTSKSWADAQAKYIWSIYDLIEKKKLNSCIKTI